MQLSVFAFAAFFAQSGIDKIRIDVESAVERTHFRTTVTQGVLLKTPRWKKDVEHPPLSPRKAIVQANAIKDRLVELHRHLEWSLDSAALVQVGEDQYYWRVQYIGATTGGAMIRRHHLWIVVLMDGTAVEPKVSKLPNPE